MKIKQITASLLALSLAFSAAISATPKNIISAAEQKFYNVSATYTDSERIYVIYNNYNFDAAAVKNILIENSINAYVKEICYTGYFAVSAEPDEDISKIKSVISDSLGYTAADSVSSDILNQIKSVPPEFTEITDLILSSDDEEILYGDLNLDNVADLSDLTCLSLHLLGDRTVKGSALKAADVQYDNEVNIADLALLKQYIIDNNISLGKDISVFTDITDLCAEYCFQTNWFKKHLENYTTFAITSMNEYNNYTETLCDEISKISEFCDISDEFFEKNILIFSYNYDSLGGAEISTTEISADQHGNIQIVRDRDFPLILEAKYQFNFSLISAPKPKNFCGNIIQKFNDTSEYERTTSNYENITENCSIHTYNCSNRIFNNPGESENGIIRNKEDFEELISKTGAVYNTEKSIEDKFNASYYDDEFFENNVLYFQTVSEGTGSYSNYISGIFADTENNRLVVTPSRFISAPDVMCTADCKEWLLLAEIPQSIISEYELTQTYTMKTQYIKSENQTDITDKCIIRTVKTPASEITEEKNCTDLRIIRSFDEYEYINRIYNGQLDYLRGSIDPDFFSRNILFITINSGRTEDFSDFADSISLTNYGSVNIKRTVHTPAEPSEDAPLYIWHNIISVSKNFFPFYFKGYGQENKTTIYKYY